MPEITTGYQIRSQQNTNTLFINKTIHYNKIKETYT